MFPLEDHRQTVETAKRILTKEKLDRQVIRYTLPSPFMSIREGQKSRRVSFDTGEELGDKIDKLLAMIGRLAAKDSGKVRPFKPQIHQNRGRGQNRGCNQRNNQNRYRSGNRLIVGIEDNLGKNEVETDLCKAIGETIGKIQEIMEDKTVEQSTGITLMEMKIMTEVGIGLETGCFPGTMTIIELGVQAIVD